MSVKHEFSRVIKQTHQTNLYKLFSAVGQAERGTDIINWISQFSYAIKELAAHLQEVCEIFVAFLQTVEPIWHYCLSGQHSHTRGQLTDTDNLSSESTNSDSNITLQFNHSESHCNIVSFHFLLRHYLFCLDFYFWVMFYCMLNVFYFSLLTYVTHQTSL